jgi:triacylglycerol lipase
VPLILLHGTFGDMTFNWINGSPLFKSQGFCVFALDYGNRGLGPIDASADRIAEFTRRVLDATGAARVSYVGHSQGGMIGRYVLRFKGLAERVDDVVGFASSNHGTTTPLAPLVAGLCPACGEQVAGSELMQRLNAGDETPPPASYTTVSTVFDEVVTPWESQALAGSPSEVTNVVLQERCPGNLSEHILIGIPGDRVALQWALNALERPGPANPRFRPDCSGQTLGFDPDPIPAATGAGPGLRLSCARAGRSLRVRGGAFRVRCRSLPAGRRRYSVSVRRRVGGQPRTLGTGRAAAAADSALVRVRLNRLGRRLLARSGERGLGVTLRASVRDGALTYQARSKVRLVRAAQRRGASR